MAEQTLPRRISSSPFERPTLALNRLLVGDVPGTARAAFAPETLSPAERATLADRWGLGGDDWFRSILRTIQNPLVLIGAILAIRYPIPTARNLFKFAPALSGVLRNPRLLRYTGNIDEIYAGLKAGRTDLPSAFKGLLRDVQGFQEVHAKSIAGAIAEYESTGRVFDKRIEIILVNHLEGAVERGILKPHTLGAPFDRLLERASTVRESIFKQVFGAVDSTALQQALRETGMSGKQLRELIAARRAHGAGAIAEAVDERLAKVLAAQKKAKGEILEQLRASGIDTSNVADIKKLDRYFPHRLATTVDEWDRQSAALVAGTAREGEFGEKMIGVAGRTQHALERKRVPLPDEGELRRMAAQLKNPRVLKELHENGAMLPSPDNLELISDQLVDPKLIGVIRSWMAGNPQIRTYSLEFDRVMSSYIHGTARAFGWTIRGHGADITDAIKRLEASGLPHNRVRAAALKDSYVPVALGRQTYKQWLAAGEWDSMRIDLVDKLSRGSLGKMLPGNVTNWLTDTLTKDSGLFITRNIQGRLASHLYLGALAMNPVASTWNMMQTLLTTIPVIGPRATLKGIQSAFRNAPKYFKARSAGIAHDEALARAFPNFGRAQLPGSPIVDEALTSAFDRAWVTSLRHPPNVTGKIDKVKAGMMALFQSSETFVRLTAFEGTMAKAAAEGLSIADAVPIAKRVVEATQFLSGPANLPGIFIGRGPLIRQFGTFPLRYLSFLTGTATEIGSAAQRGGMFGLLPNRNLGTLGRAMLSSGLAYEAGQELLGQDLSRGLLFGALPSRPEGAILSPLPFVPPAISLAAGAAQAAISGDVSPLVSQLPILVPGGVQLARMTTAYAPGVAQVIGRDFADYDNPQPDGRIPVFNRNGNLRAFATPMQLHMQALGIPPGGAGALQDERDMVKFLLTQRDRIVAYRREYLDALDSNDVRAAMDVNEDYERAYPGLGPIQWRERDLRAVRLRKMIPRLERILENLPADVRPLFGELIQTALAEEAEGLLGVDPFLLTVPDTTIRDRDEFRNVPATNVVERLQQQRERALLVPASQRRFRRQRQAPTRARDPMSSALGGRQPEPFGL